MTELTSTDIDGLHAFLLEWAGSDRLRINGQINERSEGRTPFSVGEARNAAGTVLLLNPADLKATGLNCGNDDERKWRQFWAKVAVRSGYCAPTVDPVAFAELIRLRLNSRIRIEFVFDTNGLISGVGHWLVRLLGSRSDLVRTVVTDFEVHDFADNIKWEAKHFNEWDRRALFLCASRFLEHINHPHPIWRRLDTEEETALFTAKSAEHNKKSSGRDTLLLRSARHAILDQVPGLRRFFVTGDQQVARAAMHELPQGTVIAAYVNPLKANTYLAPYAWLPANHDQGEVVCSNLATFIWEALCLCTIIEVTRSDGTRLRISAYAPGENQFPSTWSSPRIYITQLEETKLQATVVTRQKPHEDKVTSLRGSHEGETTVAPAASDKVEATSGTVEAQANAPEMPSNTNVIANEQKLDESRAKKASRPGQLSRVVWPFTKEKMRLLEPMPCASNIPGKTILKGFEEIVKSIVEKRTPNWSRVSPEYALPRLQNFLQLGGFVDTSGRIAAAGEKLVPLFAANDIDGISQLCTALKPYHDLMEKLHQNRRIKFDEVKKFLKSAEPMQGLARLLGQAVLTNQNIHDGSSFVSAEEFEHWFFPLFEDLLALSPLQEASVATMAQRALEELGLSPIRFGRALHAALNMPTFANVEPSTGGTGDRVLNEQVCHFSADGLKFVDVSADGLDIARTLKKRSK